MADNGNKLAPDARKSQGPVFALGKLFVFVAVTGALFYGVLSLVKPQYRSVAQLYIEPTNEQGMSRARSRSILAREMGVLKSPTLKKGFIAKNKLADDPEFNARLSRQGPLQRVSTMLGMTPDLAKLPQEKGLLLAFDEKLTVKKGRDLQTIKIIMRSSHPNKSARLANDYASAYIAALEMRSRQNPINPNTTRNGNDRAAIARLRTKIAASEAELLALRDQMRGEPFAPVEAANDENEIMASEERQARTAEVGKEQLSQLTTQYILARADREQAELRAKLVREMLATTGEIHSTSTVLNAGLVQRLLIKRSRLERKVADLELSLLPSHPQLKRLKREMSALQTQIKVEARKSVTDLESEALIAGAREKSLKESLDKLNNAPKPMAVAQVKELSGRVGEPAKVDPRLARAAELQLTIAERQQKLAIAQAALDTRPKQGFVASPFVIKASIVARAVAVNAPVFPKKKSITLLGMLAAFCLGLLMLVFGARQGGKGQERSAQHPFQKPQNAQLDEPRGFGQNIPTEFGARS